MLLAMDSDFNNPDSDFDPRHLHSDPDSRWHTHAGHDDHFHPSHGRSHESSHWHQRGGGHHHGHHHHDDNGNNHGRGRGRGRGRGDHNQRYPHRGRYQPRNPNYRLSREELRTIAVQTLDAIDRGWYLSDATDEIIDLGVKTEYTDAQTAYYAPDDAKVAAWATTDLGQDKKETKILIKEYSTLVGARKLHGMVASLSPAAVGDKPDAEAIEVDDVKVKEEDSVVEATIANDGEAKEAEKPEDQPSSTTPTDAIVEDNAVTDAVEETEVDKSDEVKETEDPKDKPLPTAPNHTIGVLNFASAKKPGGGFQNGAQAQEESIARSSTLYPSLRTPEGRKFYTHYHADPDNAFYTHAMVYSPAVTLFRNDKGDWKKPVDVDVLTSAAVNAGEAREIQRRDEEMYALRVRVREAELGRRADFENRWREKELKRREEEVKKREEEERKMAEAKEKADKAEEQDKSDESGEEKTPDEAEEEPKTDVEEKEQADELEDKQKADELEDKQKADETEAKEDKPDHESTPLETNKEELTEEIKSDAEKDKEDSVEPTSDLQTTEEEKKEPTEADTTKADTPIPQEEASTLPLTTPQPPADPLTPSKPDETSSTSTPPTPPDLPSFPFPRLPDLPPPPTLTSEDIETRIAETMYERIARLLFVFHQRGALHLVLGSFGTGVFKNDISMVAWIFYDLLAKPGAVFEGRFETVVFAILGGATVSVFRDTFRDKAVPDGPDELDGEDESEIEGMKDRVFDDEGDPRGGDGRVDEQPQSAGVSHEDRGDVGKEMVVDQDVQKDEPMAEDEPEEKETKLPEDPEQLEDFEMVDMSKIPRDADAPESASATDPDAPATIDSETQTQTQA